MLSPSQPPLLRDLWSPLCPSGFLGFNERIFVVLMAYIDESYTGKAEPITFGLNCVYSSGADWFWITNEWQKVIQRKNGELLSAGRKIITRVRAADLNNYQGDFEEWCGDERTEFIQNLIHKALNGNFLSSVGFTANLQELGTIWPETKYEGVITHSYDMMLQLIMKRLAEYIPEQFGAGESVSLIHDRCPYDGVLLATFNKVLHSKPEWKSLFTTIAPKGWEHCVALQPADFIAYEAMKETNRLRPSEKQRDRRQSLSAILGLPHVMAICEEILPEQFREWRDAAQV